MWRIGLALLRDALPAVTVGTLLPMALFYSALAAGSVGWAIAVSLGYAYAVGAWQWRTRKRVSGMLVVTAFMATVRAVAALLSGVPDVYFAIPVLETAGFGLMFLATLFWGEPLVLRLARDFVPAAAGNLAAQQSIIRKLSLVWTVTYLGSGATTLTLLMSLPIPVYVGAHTVTGWLWTATGAVCSLAIYRRCGGVISEPVPAAGIAGPSLAPAGATV